MHLIGTPGFVDRPRRSDCTAGQIDEKLAGGLQAGTSDSPPPLARVMGVGRQQQENIKDEWLIKLMWYISIYN